jgi:hypothetical protein
LGVRQIKKVLVGCVVLCLAVASAVALLGRAEQSKAVTATTISPDTGPTVGGQKVTITGTDFPMAFDSFFDLRVISDFYRTSRWNL